MQHSPPSPGLPPRRILVRGVNWLGDAVMTTPALLRLRERFPSAHLALLTPDKLLDLWRHHPAIDETIGFAPGEGVFSVGRRLRAGEFDLALVLPNSPRSALETRLARIPQRVGFARPWRNLFLTRAVEVPAGVTGMRKRPVGEIRKLTAAGAGLRPTSESAPSSSTTAAFHQLHAYLRLAAALGANPEPLAPRLVVGPEEIESARTRFGMGGIAGPILGLNPGAEYGPAKRWPAERFAAVVREIRRQTGCVWILFGGPADGQVAGQIESAAQGVAPLRDALRNLAGRTSLRELMALLKLCRVLLTNDSGPMHVAAALGTPVVAPFGSTSPELTAPGLPGDPRHRLLKSDAPCSPCFRRDCPIDFRCMTGIRVDRVADAVRGAVA